MRGRNLLAVAAAAAVLVAGGALTPPVRDTVAGAFADLACRWSPDRPACLIEEAKGAALQVENPFARADAVALIVQALLAEASRMDGALTARSRTFIDGAVASATAVAEIHDRIVTVLPLAHALTEAGHEQGAVLFQSLIQTVEEQGPGNSPAAALMGPESAKSEMLARIAQAQAISGDIAGARQTAISQSTQLWRVKTFAGIAEALARYGKPDQAAGFAVDAAAALKDLRDPGAADAAAGEVAGVLAAAGLVSEALALAAEPTDMVTRSFAHMAVARALADAGRLAEADEAFGRIEDTRPRGMALWSLAKARARHGDLEGAEALLEDIRMPLARNQATADIAGFQAAAGDLQGALDRIADLPPEFHRGRGLRIIVESLIYAGQLAEADEVLAGLGDDSLRHGLTGRMVAARAETGDVPLALAMARAAEDPRTRAEALLTVAAAMQGRN